MSVHALPSPAPLLPSSSRDELEPTVTLWHIAARLGCRAYGPQRLIKYLDQLVAGHGFPPPLPASVKGQVVTAINRNSRWLRVAVDHWFDGFLPPDCTAALAARLADGERAAAAAAMDARAANLRVVGVRP